MVAVSCVALPALAQLPSSSPLSSLWCPNGIVKSAATIGTTLYFGGDFTQVGPLTGAFASIDAVTGLPDMRFPQIDGRVIALAPDGAGGWYVGGGFAYVNGQSRRNAAHVRADGSLGPWNPFPAGEVRSIAVVGQTIYVGSNEVAAFDAVTGHLISGPISLGGGIATTLLVSGDRLYIGGSFSSVRGVPRRSLAAVRITSGAVDRWNPNVNGNVSAMALANGNLVIGGGFFQVGGMPRQNLASVSEATGLPTAFDPAVNSAVYALTVAGNTLYAGGAFTQVGASPRAYTAAFAVDSGKLLPWSPAVAAASGDTRTPEVLSLDVSASDVLIGGFFGQVNGLSRQSLAAVGAVTGANVAWNPRPSDFEGETRVERIVASGGAVAVGGNFEIMGGQVRRSAGAIDLATGSLLAWEPGLTPPPGRRLFVSSMYAGNARLYLSGQMAVSFGGTANDLLAALDLQTGAPDPNFVPFASTAVNSMSVASGLVCLPCLSPAGISSICALDGSTGDLRWFRPQPTPVRTLAADEGMELLFVSSNNSVRALGLADGTPMAWQILADQDIASLALEGTRLYIGGSFNTIASTARKALCAVDFPSPGAPTLSSWAPLLSGTSSSVSTVIPTPTTVYLSGGFSAIGGMAHLNLAAVSADAPQPCVWTPDAQVAGKLLLGTQHLVAYGGTLKFDQRSRYGFAAFPIVPCRGDVNHDCLLNINDFTAFQNLFAAGDPGANCDGSTTLPLLSINDFICFFNSFAAGCT
ncbi:MAG: GC-type dockerin domain-anchored protein [Phycisphaerales bacterium]